MKKLFQHLFINICIAWSCAQPPAPGQEEDTVIHCSAKPGCQISQCDPLPDALKGLGVEEYLKRNEFPITCKSKSGKEKDFNQEMDKFKKEMREELNELKANQKKSLKEVKEQLDAAENLLKGLLAKNTIPGITTTTCKNPPEVKFAVMECSAEIYKSGTVCNVECEPGREMKGNPKITCENTGKWSSSFPECACPRCRSGDKCLINTSWEEFKNGIREEGTFTYAGNQMTCSSSAYIHSWELKWECTCVDETTRTSAKCKGFKGGTGSCEHASARLIRSMIEKNVYPAACDQLETNC